MQDERATRRKRRSEAKKVTNVEIHPVEDEVEIENVHVVPNVEINPVETESVHDDEDEGNDSETDDNQVNGQNNRIKKMNVNECLICDVVIHERIDRHLNKVHCDRPEELRVFLNDFYKLRGAQLMKNKSVFYCSDCKRRFGSIPSHKRAVKTLQSRGRNINCEGKNIQRVKNPGTPEEFPNWVKNLLVNKRGYDDDHMELINEWCEKITADEKRRGRRQFTCLPSSTLAKTIAQWFHGTRKFH